MHKFSLIAFIVLLQALSINSKIDHYVEPKTVENVQTSETRAKFGGIQLPFSKVQEFQTNDELIYGPFTQDFKEWLKINGYESYDFSYSHLGRNASFGGKLDGNQKVKFLCVIIFIFKITKTPIIFIHGNSDGALAEQKDDDPSNDGWTNTIKEFLANGYTEAELYAITYGDRQIKNSLNRQMDCGTVIRLRRFVEAVLKYTGAEQIDIISHSMGVSLARRVIKGGVVNEKKNNNEAENFSCYVGESIHHKIHTFIGIAGANFGMCLCSNEKFAATAPACNKMNGFWAGGVCEEAKNVLKECETEFLPDSNILSALSTLSNCDALVGISEFLQNLNKDDVKEAKYILSLWSAADELLGKTNIVFGKRTSVIPNTDKVVTYQELSHFAVKNETAIDQYKMIHISHTNFYSTS